MAKNTLADFDTTAANNLDVAGISVAEGWLPSTVNNFERAWMAVAKKNWLDMGGQVTVAGTANAITVTSANPASYQSLISGIRFRFTAGSNNSGATTLNLDGLGAKAVRKINGGTDVALSGGEILAGAQYDLVYSTAANAAAGGWILMPTPYYDKGTFTVTLAFATPGTSSWSYATQDGTYTRNGNTVAVNIEVAATPTIGTGSGNMNILGFPFTPAANSVLAAGGISGTFTWPAGRTMLYGRVASGSTTITLVGNGSGVSENTITASHMTGGSNHIIKLTGVIFI
jgi:hypothetical protein